MNSNNRRLTDSPQTCTGKVRYQVKKRFPILKWLPNYKKSMLVADLISGITVGLTVVPQSMAYAAIAGLTPEFGLYSSYVGCILYVIFGSCKQVTIGPTAVMGLLTYETCGNDFPSCAILTGFYSGVFELLMAMLQLGWVVSFISEPVVIGFTAGAATTIISSQIKNFLGLSGPKGSGFVGYWKSVFTNIGTISLGDCLMGVCSFVVLLLLRKLKDYDPPKTPKGALLKRACWLISVSRNILIVLITTIISYFWIDPPFKQTGEVRGGFPPVGPPEFLLPANSTTTEILSFSETWSLIGAGPLIIALISVLQNVAISKAFGSGQSVDATQEMLALGLASTVGSFFSSIPISGSFSRSAVNEASGVQSPMGGLFTGILVLLSLGFLTPSFYFIPKSSLAAVIISAVMFMIEYEALPTMWRISRMDFAACLLTFFCSILIGMEFGILIGVALSLLVLLMKSLKPEFCTEFRTDSTTGIEYLYAKPAAGLSFPSVDHIRTSVMKLTQKYPDICVIVVSMEKWTTYDFSVVTALASLVKTLRKGNRSLIFVDSNDMWIEALELGGLTDAPCIPSLQDLPYYMKKSELRSTSKAKDSADKEMIRIGSRDADNPRQYGSTIKSNDSSNVPNMTNMDTSKPLL